MEQDVLINFGKRLKKLRRERGYTQLQLANECNFDRNYIGMIERGERNPTLLSLKTISEGLNISLSELLNF